ncbi:sigma factor-like helix-turn-helix DNA-binding protein [Nitrospirillum sp. BR 11164]|uniref:sigma factor-like helix-turn-helix DNA-binding protein n=1 Tax=Nitrospirillum sp. BR 11164 TaxID=3104324 RepID=UPI002AFE556B|nr:sigma factor-like helix-turn-helix DNA-binding protein [Nitrospirillum sp. BR 11164]MEA1649056.1 sigma factor-like helix-turn-helix DNA-binding protein [Nitrospirillum sp. BR 11164]
MPAHRSAPADLITEQLPCLRRYARALTGSAISGDAYVRMVLETLVQDGMDVLGEDADRGTLFRLFHRIYAGGHLELGDESPVPDTMGPGALLRTLPCERREALLLTAVEGFTPDEAAWILGLPLDMVEHQTNLARQAFRDGLRSGTLMLEDDMTIRLPQAGGVLSHVPASGGGWGAGLQ